MAVDRDARRLRRQFQRLGRSQPRLRRCLDWLTEAGAWHRRLPAALLLIAGSTLFFLPGFALWMLPLGLMLLAFDVALLRQPVLAAWIGLRRRWRRHRLSRR